MLKEKVKDSIKELNIYYLLWLIVLIQIVIMFFLEATFPVWALAFITELIALAILFKKAEEERVEDE
ncbi:hypothetical protein K8R14_02980 [bacterium]|nr:hypothetical protein [bacterium]